MMQKRLPWDVKQSQYDAKHLQNDYKQSWWQQSGALWVKRQYKVIQNNNKMPKTMSKTCTSVHEETQKDKNHHNNSKVMLSDPLRDAE